MKGFRRTVLGEMLFSLPPAIRWILVSCVSIWFAELLIFSAGWTPGMTLVLKWLALYEPLPWIWQFVTYAFLHAPMSLMHVGINMFMLWMFGRELESRWGSASFLRFYLVCAVGAGLCHVVAMALFPPLDSLGPVPVLGASGAIFGLLAAYGLVFPERMLLLFFVFPIKAKYAVMLFGAIELMAVWSPDNGIANLAHLGGMLTAWIYLKQGWRLTQIKPIQQLRDKFEAARQARRRSRFKVIDEKQWDAWLEDDSTDETEH